MPVLCPQPVAAEVRSLYELEESPFAQGGEAQLLFTQFDEVRRHWLDHAAQPVPSPEDDDLLPYRHVPFEVVGTRRVRYKEAGPLKPRRFSIEEDDA